jgi:hypothetical protein
VLKITNAGPALEPPVVATQNAEINSQGLLFKGKLVTSGNAEKVKVGFQYREYAGFVEELYSDKWNETKTIEVPVGEEFELKSNIIKEGITIQYRAFVDHPKLRVYGDIKRINF